MLHPVIRGHLRRLYREHHDPSSIRIYLAVLCGEPPEASGHKVDAILKGCKLLRQAGFIVKDGKSWLVNGVDGPLFEPASSAPLPASPPVAAAPAQPPAVENLKTEAPKPANLDSSNAAQPAEIKPSKPVDSPKTTASPPEPPPPKPKILHRFLARPIEQRSAALTAWHRAGVQRQLLHSYVRSMNETPTVLTPELSEALDLLEDFATRLF